MSVTEARVKRALRRKLRGYEPRTYIEAGVTGDFSGNTDAGGNRTYVRVRDMVTIAHNNLAGQTKNTPVWVGYTKENKRLFQVISEVQRGGVEMPWAMSGAIHHQRHEWPTGDDVTWIAFEQIRNLRVYPVDGTVTVKVEPGMSEGADNWARVYRTAALDLSGDVPGAGALWALVYIDNLNAITYTLGDTADSLELLTSAYIPQTPSGAYSLAAVRLYAGQTEIIESAYPSNNDIVDLRYVSQAGLRRDFLQQLALVESELDFDITSILMRRKDYYLSPTSVTLVAGTSANTVTDLQTWLDGNIYHIDEAAATPGQDLRVNFTNVARLLGIRVSAYYAGSSTHAVRIQLYNYDTTGWDTIHTIETGMDYEYIVAYIPDDTDYIDASNNAIFRFYHTENGNSSHDSYIDYAALVVG